MSTEVRPASILLLLVCGLLANTSEAMGQERSQRHRGIQVGVLPVRALVRSPGDLSEARPEVRELQEQEGLWQRRLEQTLDSLDLVSVVVPQQVRERLRARAALQEKVSVARERFSLGLEAYRQLDLDRALINLDRARELNQSIGLPLLDGGAMADTALYRGLVFMEQGEAHRAHISFQEMWAADPGRRFQPGYYTSATEEAMESALLDLRDLAASGGALPSTDDLGQLATSSAVDTWVFARLERSESGASAVRLVVFDASSGTLAVDERIDLEDDQALERLERLLSAWHACALSTEKGPSGRPPAPRARLLVSLAPSYALFLKHDRTRAPVHSPGGVVGIAWEVSGPLELFAQANHMATLPDRNRDLLETFVTSRITAGVGLGAAGRRWSFSGRAGLEMAISLAEGCSRLSKVVARGRSVRGPRASICCFSADDKFFSNTRCNQSCGISFENSSNISSAPLK